MGEDGLDDVDGEFHGVKRSLYVNLKDEVR